MEREINKLKQSVEKVKVAQRNFTCQATQTNFTKHMLVSQAFVC